MEATETRYILFTLLNIYFEVCNLRQKATKYRFSVLFRANYCWYVTLKNTTVWCFALIHVPDY